MNIEKKNELCNNTIYIYYIKGKILHKILTNIAKKLAKNAKKSYNKSSVCNFMRRKKT